MDDRYFFDKRVMKKAFIKYGIIFLIALPILLFANYFLNDYLSFWLVVLIDAVIVLTIILIAQLIINAFVRYREEHPKKEKIKKPKTIKTKNNESEIEVNDKVLDETKNAATLNNENSKTKSVKSPKKEKTKPTVIKTNKEK